MGDRGVGDGPGSDHIDGLVGGPGVRVVGGVGEADDLPTRVHGGEGAAAHGGPSADDAGRIVGVRGGDAVIRGHRAGREDEVDRTARLTGKGAEGEQGGAFDEVHDATDIRADGRSARGEGGRGKGLILRDAVARVHRQGAATERERTQAVGGEGGRDGGERAAERDAPRARERGGRQDRGQGRLAQGDADAIGDRRDDGADVDARAGDRHADEEGGRAARVIQSGAHRGLIDGRREGRSDRSECRHRGAIRDARTADILADGQGAQIGDRDAGLADDATSSRRGHGDAEGGEVAGRNADEGLADEDAGRTGHGGRGEDRGGRFLVQGDADARRDRGDDRASGDTGAADRHADEEFRRGTGVGEESAHADLVSRRDEGRDGARDAGDDGTRDDARTTDDLARGQARGRGHRDGGTTDGAAGGDHAGGRARQDVRGIRGAAEVEEQRTLVEHGATEMRLVTAEDEGAFARLRQGTEPLQARRRLNGDRAARVDLDRRGVGEVDVEATRGRGIHAGEREVRRGVEVAEDAAGEVEIADGVGVRQAGRTGDATDEERTRGEGVVRAAVRTKASREGATEHEGADAGRAAILRERGDVRSRGERARGFGGGEADNGSVEEAAVEGERTRARRAGRAAGEITADLDHRGADVELRTGEVDRRGAGNATRRKVINEERSGALLAAVLGAEHEDRVDDAAADRGGGASGVLTELETIRIEEIDRAEVDGVRLAGGIGRLATEGEATRGDRVDAGEIQREADIGGRRGSVEGGTVRVEGRTAEQGRLIREHRNTGHIQGAVDRTAGGIGNAVGSITDQADGAVGDGDIAGVAFQDGADATLGLDVAAEVEGRATRIRRESGSAPEREGLVGFEVGIAAVEDDFAGVEAGAGQAQGTDTLLAELGRPGEGADAQGVRDDVEGLRARTGDGEHARTEVEAVRVGERDGPAGDGADAERAVGVRREGERRARTVVDRGGGADGEETAADGGRVVDAQRTRGEVRRTRVGVGLREDDGAAVEVVQDELIGARQDRGNRQRATAATEDVAIGARGDGARVGDGGGSAETKGLVGGREVDVGGRIGRREGQRPGRSGGNLSGGEPSIGIAVETGGGQGARLDDVDGGGGRKDGGGRQVNQTAGGAEVAEAEDAGAGAGGGEGRVGGEREAGIGEQATTVIQGDAAVATQGQRAGRAQVGGGPGQGRPVGGQRGGSRAERRRRVRTEGAPGDVELAGEGVGAGELEFAQAHLGDEACAADDARNGDGPVFIDVESAGTGHRDGAGGGERTRRTEPAIIIEGKRTRGGT